MIKIKDLIYEGLISSTNIDLTMTHLEKWMVMTDKCKIMRQGDKITITFFENPNTEEIDNFEHLLQTLGWFISAVSFRYPEDIRMFWEKYNRLEFLNSLIRGKLLTIQLEPKFEPELSVYEYPILYHLTLTSKIEKIKKIGLVPKSKEKISNHPDRIFMTSSLDSCKTIADRFHKLNKNTSKFTILKVNFKSSYDNNTSIRLFQDPNFKDGVFTLSNIPSKYLEIVDTINYNKK